MSKKANKKIQTVTEPTAEHVTTQGIQIKVAEKVCGKCKRLLPAKDFWGSRASKDGLQGACKDCQLETPLGTHTTKVPTVMDGVARKSVAMLTEAAINRVEKKVAKVVAAKKRTRPSRAHPIGSGQRKECAKCKFKIAADGVQATNGGKCMNAAAIADKENKAKVCPYKE
jgi:hypothetical protein